MVGGALGTGHELSRAAILSGEAERGRIEREAMEDQAVGIANRVLRREARAERARDARRNPPPAAPLMPPPPADGADDTDGALEARRRGLPPPRIGQFGEIARDLAPLAIQAFQEVAVGFGPPPADPPA